MTDEVEPLHPVLVAAAGGELPRWAEASDERRAHVRRVSDLLGAWADAFGLDPMDRTRWRAAGMLHDVLRDADPETLRPVVDPDLRTTAGPMLHGPAAAARLRDEGVDDTPLILAVSWHTLGHPGFDRLGKALYLADFLEPGREYESEERRRQRERVPDRLDGVLREVARDRIARSLRKGRPLLPQTVGFWNALIDGR